jgi:RNA-binding protein FUS
VKDAEQKAAAGWLHAGLRDTSNRIFVQGFDPITTSEDDLKELFSGIGVIARVRQRFGFPDQWPHAVKIYRDASTGKAKDEAVIKYDDPMAAQSAPGFYDGHELKGKKLSVSIATSREDREGGGRGDRGGDRGDRGGGRGYNDRRGGYDDRRGGDRGYDDRRGGDRHRPY